MKNKYQKAFVRQRDQSDCGAACLATVINYYNGRPRLEHLRTISGTTQQGATMLGLYQAAHKVGFEAKAYKADLKNLKQLDAPCILHVLKEGALLHYVVCFGYKDGQFIVSDPAEEVKYLSEKELSELWDSRALLTLTPTRNFEADAARSYSHWDWFVELIREDTNLLGIAGVLSTFTTILALSVPVFSQKLIDEILPDSHQLKLTIGLALLFFLLLVRNGLTYIREYFLIWQTKDFNNRIINYFYGSLLRLPKAFFDTRKIGELVARMNDTVRIQNAIRHLTTNIMVDIILVLVATLAVFLYSPRLGWIASLYIPVYFGITYLYHNKIVRRQRHVMQSFAQTESNYVDTIQGIGSIKSSHQEDHFFKKTRNIYNKFQTAIYNLGLVRIRFNVVTDIVSTFIILAILSWGSFMVFQENLKLGAFMGIIQLVLMLMPAVGRIALTNIQLQEARVAFERMFEFTSMPPEYDLEKEQEKTSIKKVEVLRAQNLSFQFPGRSPLLKDISLELKKGEMVGLLGESGSGKSTLLQILLRFYQHDEGQLTLNGQPLDAFNVEQWRQKVGYVPQTVKIFNGSLLYNIALSPQKEALETARQFCDDWQLDPYFRQFPQGYQTILGEEGVNISGGQQQLVVLARALYQQPEVLFLDEATGAMDRKTENFVLSQLKSIKRETLILMVTHRLKIVKQMDRIYTLRDGQIQGSGTHQQLLEIDEEYAGAWQELTG